MPGNDHYNFLAVNAGKSVQIGNGGTTGELLIPALLANGASLTYHRSDDLTTPLSCSGTGATLIKQGGNTLTTTGNNDIGQLQITCDTFATMATKTTTDFINSNSTGLFEGNGAIFSGATFSYGVATNQILTGQENVTIGITQPWVVPYQSVTSGDGAFRKPSVGTLVIGGVLGHTGGTTVPEGSLEISHSGSISTAAKNITLGTTPTLSAPTLGNLTLNQTTSNTLAVQGNGTLTKKATGTLKLSGGTLNGSLNLSGGTVELANATISQGSSTITNLGTTLHGTGTLGNTTLGSTAHLNSGAITINASTAQFSLTNPPATKATSLQLVGSKLIYTISSAPLPNWRTLHNLPADGSQDLGNPSGDGIPNLLKYAFNLAPNRFGRVKVTVNTP